MHRKFKQSFEVTVQSWLRTFGKVSLSLQVILPIEDAISRTNKIQCLEMPEKKRLQRADSTGQKQKQIVTKNRICDKNAFKTNH
jgi:hypothetical protein